MVVVMCVCVAVNDEDKKGMGRSAAARRERRQEKRQVAKATRPTKYANQKGGSRSIQKKRLPRSNMQVGTDDEVDDMVVVRGGAPVLMRGSGAAGQLGMDAIDVDSVTSKIRETEDDEDGFTSAQKKVRALHKKIRRIRELEERRRQGVELDFAQQALLRSKPKLERELVKFEAVVASQVHDAESSESDSNEVEPHAAAVPAVAESGGGSRANNRLEQRRALKKQRHAEKLARKRMQ
jgi:hypothetical protein